MNAKIALSSATFHGAQLSADALVALIKALSARKP